MKLLRPLTAALLLLSIPAWAAGQKPGDAKPAPAVEPEDTKKSVVITGGLSGSEVTVYDSAHYWLTIENRTNVTIKNLSVQLEVAADEFRATCRLASAKTDSPGCGSSTVDIEPNRAITIQGELRALQGTESRNINALITYDLPSQTDSSSRHSERALSLGTLIAKTWPRELFDNFKELILPVTLALVGYFVARHQNDRAQIAQTWNNMLPVSHEMATQFYTPMSAAVQRVLLDARKFNEPQDAAGNINRDALSLYFHLLLTWRRFERTIEEKGGIYFKSRVGEMLVLLAIAEFRRAYKGETTTNPALTQEQKNTTALERERCVKAIFKQMPHQMDLPQFMTIWEQYPASWNEAAQVFHAGWDDFRSWYGEEPVRDRVLKLLSVFALILDYEMNRPYEKWYNSQEKLAIDDTQERTLESLMATAQQRTELAAYLQAAKEGNPI